MTLKLHDYQRIAAEWLLDHPRAGLFLEPGLGKTVTTITALEALRLTGELRRVLIAAPLRVARDVWAPELEKWGAIHDLTHATAVGTPEKRRAALAADADVTITSVSTLEWLLDEFHGEKLPYDTLVVDELSLFKSRKAQRLKMLQRHLHGFDRIYGLTGTPFSTSLLNLWAQMGVIDQGESLGAKFSPFRAKYFVLGQKHNGEYKDKRFDTSYELKEGADDEIYEAIGERVISMRAADYLKIPEFTRTVHELAFTAPQKAAYRKFVRDKVLELEGGVVTAANAAILAGKLAQFTAGAVYDEEGTVQALNSIKLDVIREIVDELQGSPVLIFYGYKHERDRILDAIPGAEVYTEDTRERWNKGEIPALLLHPASAGHGLNLQAGGHTVIWATTPWSGELYTQANARVYRQGQKHPVVVHHVVIEGTVDERALDVVVGRVAGNDAVLLAMRAEVAA